MGVRKKFELERDALEEHLQERDDKIANAEAELAPRIKALEAREAEIETKTAELEGTKQAMLEETVKVKALTADLERKEADFKRLTEEYATKLSQKKGTDEGETTLLIATIVEEERKKLSDAFEKEKRKGASRNFEGRHRHEKS